MYNVIFAGQSLNNYCRVLSIQREVLPPRENFTKSIPNRNGSQFTGFHYGERTFTVEVCFTGETKEELIEKARQLAKVLDVKNPSKLILSDEQDKYYYAVVDGNTSIDRQFNTAKTTITFICYNPVAYSSLWQTYLPDDKGIVEVTNEGTAETFPSVEVAFNNNACFLQLTNYEGKTILIGQPRKEVLETIEDNLVLINDDCSSSTTFTSLASSLLEDSKVADGLLGVGENGTGIVCTNYGTETEDKWTGGALRRNLDTTVKNFVVEADVIFASGNEVYIVPPNASNTEGDTTLLGTYEVTAKTGLNVRTSYSTSSSRKGAMPYGTQVVVKEIKNGWARHNYKNWNGWSDMRYLKKISSKTKTVEANISTQENEFYENEMGLIEIYGYTSNGGRLFKAQISDATAWYEFVEPMTYIGGDDTLVLQSGKLTPTPNTVAQKDDNGKVTYKKVSSGMFGDFNDCVGKFVIKRDTSSTGNQLWSCSFYKYKNGQIVKTISTANWLSNANYPKGDLAYLGLYIAKYGANNPVSHMVIDNLKVTKINPAPAKQINYEIFKKGDVVNIDFESGEITKNGVPFLTSLDIGSEFFTIPTGTSQFIINSDDRQIEAVIGLQARYL